MMPYDLDLHKGKDRHLSQGKGRIELNVHGRRSVTLDYGNNVSIFTVKRWRHYILYVISAMILSLSGCGYSFQGAGALPGRVERVSVALFSNQTGQIGAEASMTRALMEALMQASHVEICNTPESADAVVRGAIRSISFGALSRTADDAVYERSVAVKIDLKMVSRSGETLFSLSKMSESDTYVVPEGNEADEQAKKEAVNAIFHRLSERIVSQMTDDF